MREVEFQRRMRHGDGIRLQPRATGRPLGGAKLRPDTCRQRQARVTDKQAALIRRACEPPALHTAVPGQARPQAGRAPHTPAPHARGDPGCGRARRRGAGRRGGGAGEEPDAEVHAWWRCVWRPDTGDGQVGVSWQLVWNWLRRMCAGCAGAPRIAGERASSNNCHSRAQNFTVQ